MRLSSFLLFSGLVCCTGLVKAQTDKAIRLADVPWTDAEKALDSSAVVVIPMGAGSKEHGPHLPLGCDLLQATWLADRIAATEKVVMAPEMDYGYYYFFTNFPGSTSVRFTVQRDMLVDICRRLSAFGPRRFYVINIGISTVPPLKAAAAQLAREGILLRFTDLEEPRTSALEKKLCSEKEGTHADEVETSLMLYMHPEHVDMSKAVCEYGTKNGPGMMVRTKGESGMYAPSGIYGDATLATRAKGEVLANNMLAVVANDIDSLRKSLPPAPVKESGSEEYAGTYATADSMTFVVQVEHGALVLINSKGLRAPLYSEGNDHFPGSFADVRFLRNDAGIVRALEVILNDGKFVRADRRKQ